MRLMQEEPDVAFVPVHSRRPGLGVLRHAQAELRWGIPECFTMMEMRRNGLIPALAPCDDAHIETNPWAPNETPQAGRFLFCAAILIDHHWLSCPFRQDGCCSPRTLGHLWHGPTKIARLWLQQRPGHARRGSCLCPRIGLGLEPDVSRLLVRPGEPIPGDQERIPGTLVRRPLLFLDGPEFRFSEGESGWWQYQHYAGQGATWTSLATQS
ncbi:hypothetical protein CCMA1212_010295 [Trichoderma ghanense]|uniref:Uncharacterized protein n=1 Tax=Trichoderma ghanense TaxID=65468 RepID=A0ABY2GPU8_9HYPO